MAPERKSLIIKLTHNINRQTWYYPSTSLLHYAWWRRFCVKCRRAWQPFVVSITILIFKVVHMILWFWMFLLRIGQST